MVGARPVLVDIVGPDEPTLAPGVVRAALTPRTRAIVAVHYGGWSTRLAELRAIADAAGAVLVEDAAHAPLVPSTEVPGRHLGTIGDAGCFSFHATKNLACGEGGMVVARDPAVRDRVRRLRSHAMTGPTSAPYDVAEVGYNHRPTDLTAAIARAQLARLPAENAARRALAAEYHRLLAPLPVTVPFTSDPGSATATDPAGSSIAACTDRGASAGPAAGAGPARATSIDARTGLATAAASAARAGTVGGERPSAHHLMPIVLPEGTDRPAVQAALREAGIQTGVHYPPIHRFSAYRGMAAGDLSQTEAIADRILSLPIHGRLGPDDAGRVVDVLAGALGSTPVMAGASRAV
jgi:dTDP-4-amino-4,6-dideoxygalactose transaminase